MKLAKRQPIVRQQPIRENAVVVEQFKALCARKGWPIQGAMKVLVHAFLENPGPLSKTTSPGPKDSYLPGWWDRADMHRSLKKIAKKARLPASEVIRQIIRKHLEEQINA